LRHLRLDRRPAERADALRLAALTGDCAPEVLSTIIQGGNAAIIDSSGNLHIASYLILYKKRRPSVNARASQN
jgi:hypothetical protein